MLKLFSKNHKKNISVGNKKKCKKMEFRALWSCRIFTRFFQIIFSIFDFGHLFFVHFPKIDFKFEKIV